MSQTIDIIASQEGQNFRLTPVSKFAREYFGLKFGGTVDMKVDSVELDSIQFGRLLRWCDQARVKVWMNAEGGAA